MVSSTSSVCLARFSSDSSAACWRFHWRHGGACGIDGTRHRSLAFAYARYRRYLRRHQVHPRKRINSRKRETLAPRPVSYLRASVYGRSRGESNLTTQTAQRSQFLLISTPPQRATVTRASNRKRGLALMTTTSRVAHAQARERRHREHHRGQVRRSLPDQRSTRRFPLVPDRRYDNRSAMEAVRLHIQFNRRLAAGRPRHDRRSVAEAVHPHIQSTRCLAPQVLLPHIPTSIHGTTPHPRSNPTLPRHLRLHIRAGPQTRPYLLSIGI